MCPTAGDEWHAQSAFRIATPTHPIIDGASYPATDSPIRVVSPVAFGILNKSGCASPGSTGNKIRRNVFHISREAEKTSDVDEVSSEFPSVPLHIRGRSQSLTNVPNEIFWKNRELEDKLLESMKDVMIPKDIAQFAMRRDGHVLVAMVGLPARGKSFIAKALCRHLNWLGIGAGIFNAGSYRRKLLMDTTSSVFDPANTKGFAVRQECAKLALEAAFRFLAVDGHYVAFFDATNTTKERRRWIQEEVDAHIELNYKSSDSSRNSHIQLVFLESQCHDNEKIWKNIRDAKRQSPDYVGWKEHDIMMDFMSRIAHYERVYKSVTDDEGYSYIRLENTGCSRERLVVYQCKCYALGRVVQLLNHLTLTFRCIILTRPGDTYESARGMIGNGKRSTLNPTGVLYAEKFASAIQHLSQPPDSTDDSEENNVSTNSFFTYTTSNVMTYDVRGLRICKFEKKTFNFCLIHTISLFI